MMNQTEIGKFIAQCRMEKKMTQAQLAEKLNITDMAVSKWETGKSMPDASSMPELCQILGITVNELLRGEKVKPKAMRTGRMNKLMSVLFSIALLIGIMVCLICDIAISGRLTWSLIPVSSLGFAWVIVFPGMILGRRGVVASFVSLSVFILPYLLLLSLLLEVKEVFSIGAVMAVISIVFLWIVVGIFCLVGKAKKRVALGITFLMAIPFQFVINFSLSKRIGEPVFDIWDTLSIFLLLIFAFVSFLWDYDKKEGEQGL